MSINNDNLESEVAYTIMHCSKLTKKQLDRLTGEERKIIEKMLNCLQFKMKQCAPKSIELNNLITHLNRIDKGDKKVFFITALFRDFVKSRNDTLSQLGFGKQYAQEVIAIDLYSKLRELTQKEVTDQTNDNYKNLKLAALAGDGYAISYLKSLIVDRGIKDDTILNITDLYMAALSKNHPAIVRSEINHWSSMYIFTTFTEPQLNQMFNYIQARAMHDDYSMAELCRRLKAQEDVFYSFSQETQLKITKHLERYSKID